jgi:hypothetical protein
MATRIYVSPTACRLAPWSEIGWSELLRVELAADGISVELAEASHAAAHPHVAVEVERCDDTTTSATIAYVTGERERARTIDLGDVAPIARGRVLAMAIADLVRSGVTEQPTAAAPLPVTVPAHVDLATATTQPSAHRSLAVLAMADARLFSRGPNGLVGARTGSEISLVDHVALEIDAGLLFGRARDRLGSIDATLGTIGAVLLATGRTSTVNFGVGVRGEVGMGWFQGVATTSAVGESRARSPLAFGAISGVARIPLAGEIAALVAVDVGTTIDGFVARADQRRVLDVSGPMIAARVGISWGARPQGH